MLDFVSTYDGDFVVREENGYIVLTSEKAITPDSDTSRWEKTEQRLTDDEALQLCRSVRRAAQAARVTRNSKRNVQAASVDVAALAIREAQRVRSMDRRQAFARKMEADHAE